MLAIAIKNTVLLALVILISHFLLKGSIEDRMPTLQAQDVSSTLPSSSVIPLDAKGHVDDLYSYVYGERQTDISEILPAFKPKPKPVTYSTAAAPDTGMLIGYESASEQWSEIPST